MSKKRLFHISNRVDIPEPGVATAGGLDEAIAIAPEGYDVVRLGWSGKTVKTLEEARNSRKTTVRGNVTYETFDLPEDMFKGYYNKIANGYLWPLFHYRTDVAAGEFDRNSIKDYIAANKFFAEMAAPLIQPDDAVVVHDYQLMLVGKYLLESGIENPTSFFLHIPSPSANLIESLPRDEQEFVYYVTSSLYHYDFVGLQSQTDFLSMKTILYDKQDASVPGIFETATWQKGVVPGRTTQFGPFPVAGNTMSYIPQAEEWAVRKETHDFLREHAPNGQADTLGIDRLDYTKALVPKAYGTGRWLRDFGKKGESLNLLQVAPFGRDAVPAYQNERNRVESAFGMLKAAFEDPSVLYQEKVPRPMLLGMSRLARIGLVTPLRDGFNLVACEMLASWDPKDPGVLVLSKHVGAAGLLRDASIQVDPVRAENIARGIERARQMPLSQRQEMHGRGMEILKEHTNERWQNGLIQAGQAGAALRIA